MNRSCRIVGATGLVGGHVLRRVLEDPAYASVVTLSRRPLGVTHAKLRDVQVDFDRPETLGAHGPVDDVFCCLGTTMKKAGSRDAFRKVDFQAPVDVARAARGDGATQFLIVSAVGADATSGVFYNRVKGEVEAALRAIDFPRGLQIFHPSVLLGDRGESRPAERIAASVLGATRKAFVGPLARYRAIEADEVARAMIAVAHRASPGANVYEGDALFSLAAA